MVKEIDKLNDEVSSDSILNKIINHLKSTPTLAYTRKDINKIFNKNYNWQVFGNFMWRIKKLNSNIKSKRIGIIAYYYYDVKQEKPNNDLQNSS